MLTTNLSMDIINVAGSRWMEVAQNHSPCRSFLRRMSSSGLLQANDDGYLYIQKYQPMGAIV